MTRRWSPCFLLLWPALFLCGVTAWATVRYDMTREELLKEMGKPTSTLKNPATGREILNFPKGVRIELDKGVVVSVKGLDMAAVEEATKAAAAQKAEAEEAARIEREAQEKIAAVEAAAAAKAEMPASGPGTKHAARARIEDEAEDDIPDFSLGRFLGGQVLWFALMIVALKLTAMYRNVEIEWSGLLIAAGADTGTRTILGLVEWYAFHATTLFYVNQLAATGVLLLVLKKVSLNQTWQKAARVAFGVKAFMLVLRFVAGKLLGMAV